MTRLTLLTMVVLIPGGLLVLAAYLLAQAVARQLQLEQGARFAPRFARAVSAVRLRDVWTHARKSLKAS